MACHAVALTAGALVAPEAIGNTVDGQVGQRQKYAPIWRSRSDSARGEREHLTGGNCLYGIMAAFYESSASGSPYGP